MVLFGSGGRKARLIGSALLIATFIAGALAGAAVIRVVSAEGPDGERFEHRARFGGPRGFVLDDQLADEIGLSAEQRTQVRAILERRDREAKEMWGSFQPRLHEFGNAVRGEIHEVLTPAQRERFDSAIDQRRKEWKQRCRGDSAKAQKEESVS